MSSGMSSRFFRVFVRDQCRQLPYPTQNFTGQTVIVTGANVGLGLEASKHFVRLGAARVILACRSPERARAAKQRIEAETGRAGVVDVWSLDLCSYESVREFAARARTLGRIDAVVENAGIARDFKEVAEGAEMTITVNVYATFLLAALLIPVLEESSRRFNITPRLTIVTSDVHHMTVFPESSQEQVFDYLDDADKADMTDRYNVSKLIQVYAVRELASKIDPAKSGFVLNMLNPGLCYSSLSRDLHGINYVFVTIFRFLLARTTEVGSRTLVHAAGSGLESHGQYLSDCLIEENAVSRKVRSEEGGALQKKIWSQLRAKLEKIQPGLFNGILNDW